MLIGGIFLWFYPRQEEKIERGAVVALVPDKISQSAPIPIALPKNVALANAQSAISFNPQIEGRWLEQKEKTIVFQPKNKLEVGKHYMVSLITSTMRVEKDFLADEDPNVIGIFPNKEQEAQETSDITIMFNRPIAPLSTRDVLDASTIPVEITPQTEGKFRWISTRSLQFIPKTRLHRSTTYTVSIKPIMSIEGLSVPPFTQSFTTRPLRYEFSSKDFTLYDKPIIVKFNQPVDLERTKREITVKQADGKQTAFKAVYGIRQLYDNETKKSKRYIDKSVINLYGARDRNGREGFWDFSTDYHYVIGRAYPLEGDIVLRESREGGIHVPEIISGMSADSPRSDYVEPDVFDPQGKLYVTFFEDIDSAKSKIQAKNLRDIQYGEKCKRDENGEEIRIGDECAKEIDKAKLVITFNPAGLANGERIPLMFEKIVNVAGIILNPQAIIKTIITYPKLVILRTSPESNAKASSLEELKVCTSTPLTPAEEDTFKERLKSNYTVGLWNWNDPHRIKDVKEKTPCKVGEFENVIRYGLIPQTIYRLTLNLVDDFKQTASKEISFTSGTLSYTARQFFHLQKQYNVTSQERTILTYAVENLEYVNIDICKISAFAMLGYVHDFPYNTTPPSGFSCTDRVQKAVQLPKKFWTRNYFQISLKDYIPHPLGHYIISFGHPEYRRLDWQWNEAAKKQIPTPGPLIYERTLLIVTKLAVTQKELQWEGGEYDNRPDLTKRKLNEALQNLYWISEFGSLVPVGNATIDMYQEKSSRPFASVKTGVDGIAKAPVVPKLWGAIATNGLDSAIISPFGDNLQWASSARSAVRTYMYTDRPIYRPGQEVFIKGIYRIGFDGDYEIFRDKKADIEIFNSKNESIGKQSVDVSDYGTFMAAITLDTKSALGTYRIQALGGSAYFDVEEYVPAAFKLDVASQKEEYIAGDTMELNVDANYYFGVAVEGGDVEYALLSQDYYFDKYKDQYFGFGNDWYYSYNGDYGDTFLLRGKTALDSSGKARITEKLDFAKFFKKDEGNKSKIFIVSTTVKNKNGQSVSMQKSFIVHRGEFYLGAYMRERFFAKNEKSALKIKSVDINGKPMPVSSVTLEINKITWEYFKRKEVDGGYYYQSEEKKKRVKDASLSTDSNGDGAYDVSVAEEGEYEVALSAIDERGNKITSQQDFYVYGSGQVTVRHTNNETLDLATDKSEVAVGDEVKIIIKSPFTNAKALVSIERGKIFQYEVIDVKSNLTEYTVKIKDSYIPNVYVSILLLSPRPDVKYGQIHYKVNTKERTLTIEAKPNKTRYLPGENVRLDVSVKDDKGRPVEAEFSLAVADLSVLALKGNPKKNPVVFFYEDEPLTVTTASNVKQILYEPDVPLGTKGGGGEPEDLTKKRRGIFKDTALWKGTVQTNSSGKAQISFTLPDNLTTWQIESLGVTKNTKLGVGYGEFMTKKDVMTIPLRPRFIIPGDEFLMGANVFNQTQGAQRFTVSIDAPTLTIEEKSKNISVGAGESETVYFSAKAPKNMREGKHKFTLSAKNAAYEDTVDGVLPITPNMTYESTATANYTNGAQTKEYIYIPQEVEKDRGGVSIKTSATLAVYLSDALNSLISFPYGCSEQIASKLSSLAIVKRGLGIKNIPDAFTLKQVVFEGKEYSLDDVVRIGLSSIYENQYPEGGFAYYKGLAPNVSLTLHIVQALQDLKEAGYEIQESSLQRGARYLYSQITQNQNLLRDNNLVVLTAYILSRLSHFDAENALLKNRIEEIVSDKTFINERISNTSLSYLAILLIKGYSSSLKEKIFSILENRVRIDGRGAFLDVNGTNWLYDYYETPIKDTALLLKAFVADKRETPLRDKILRWLLLSRAKDGAWGSTNNTLTVVDALTDFLIWKRELDSSFIVNLDMNGKKLGDYTFNKENILKTFISDLAIKDIPVNQLQTLTFSKTNQNSAPNNFYYDAALTYFLPIDAIPARDEGFFISQTFYARDDEKNATPLTKAIVGDVVKGHLSITVPKSRNFAMVESFIPAGMEVVNLHLATEDQTLKKEKTANTRFEKYNSLPNSFGDNGFLKSLFASRVIEEASEELPDEAYNPTAMRNLTFSPDFEESHDDRVVLFKERLQPGVYEYDYFVRALIPGAYNLLPTVVSELYFPEHFGRTEGKYFTVEKK